MLKNVVFLDRDGVINRDSPEYVKSTDEFAFLPRSLDAIARLTAANRPIIVITNQSALNRGLIDGPTLQAIHTRMQREVAAHGGRITDIFFCPHRPDESCRCRKPKPGLIRQAQTRHDIDLASAVMVGDNAKDILCAQRAGCAAAILVRTGSGRRAELEIEAGRLQPSWVADDLFAAVQWILGRQNR